MYEEAPQRDYHLREVFNGLRYISHYGIAWRTMPNKLPPWSAVYQQSQCRRAASCFEALAHDLGAVLRAAPGAMRANGRHPSTAGRCVRRLKAAH
jgi:transposase